MTEKIQAVRALDSCNSRNPIASMKAQTEVHDPDQKRFLEEILGSIREMKAEAAARHQRKAAKEQSVSELLAMKNKLEEQTALAEADAASKLLEQKASFTSIIVDTQQALLSEKEKTAAAVERADSQHTRSVGLAQELQALQSSLEEQRALAEEAASKALVQKALHNCILRDAQQAHAAARKEAELLSGNADTQLRVSRNLQADTQVLRKEKEATHKEMEHRHKQALSEMEASKLHLAGAMASLQQELAAAQQAAATATAAEKRAAAEAACLQERFEVEAEKRAKALAKIERLEADLSRLDKAGANHGSNAPMPILPHKIDEQQEISDEDGGTVTDQEAKDIATATAASLETGHCGASSSAVCEVCRVAPHKLEDCPLVQRVSAGAKETAQEKEEEGEWQQVKAAPAKAPKQPVGHKGKGSAQVQGKGKQAGQHGGKGQKGAGRVIAVSRGKPAGRLATPQSPQEGRDPPSLPSTTSNNHPPESACPSSRRDITTTYANVLVRSNSRPNSYGPAPDPKAGSR